MSDPNSLADASVEPSSVPGALVSELSDAELLEGWVTDRQQKALAALMRRYDPLVRRVCAHQCRDLADRDDAYQTTFLYLADRAASIRHPECLPGWLHRVAHRAATAMVKQRFSQSAIVDVSDDQTAEPLVQVSDRHDALVLDEALAELPEKYRSVLVLKHFEDDSVAQIADRLELTEGAVRGRLQRGRSMLAARLRKQGFIPFVVLGAALSIDTAWADSPALSPSEATEAFLRTVETSQPLPPSPISLASVDALFSGNLVMSKAVIGAVAASCLLATILYGTSKGHADQASPMVTILAQQAEPSSEETFDQSTQFQAELPPAGLSPAGSSAAGSRAAGPNAMNPGGMNDITDSMGMMMGMGGMGGMESGPPQRHEPQLNTTRGEPTSPLATQWKTLLDQPVDYEVGTSLSGFLEGIDRGDMLPAGIPRSVFLNRAAIKLAGAKDMAIVKHDFQDEPLRVILRKVLQPHGLNAVVTNDGLEITADYAILAQQGINADQWVGEDEAFMKRVEVAMQKELTVTFVETPLKEAIEMIARQSDLPISIDHQSLEEFGITSDHPCSLTAKEMPLASALTHLLSPLDVVVTVNSNRVTVMTGEASTLRPLKRIYWLDGLVAASDGFDRGTGTENTQQAITDIINTIETSLAPESWEAIGGEGTISPVHSSRRPGLIISNTYQTHRQIETYFRILRENAPGS